MLTDRDGVTIRPMRTVDVAAVQTLWAEAGLSVRTDGRDSRAALEEQLRRYPTTYLVATRADRIVGVVLGTHDGRKGWINRLAVHPEYRRRGIALALILACERALYKQDIEIVATLVEHGNDASAATFERAEFVADVPVHYLRKLRRPDI